jgi:hypothetical protein
MVAEHFAREHEVEAALLEPSVDRVGQARLAHDQVGAHGEDRRRQAGHEHEREHQAPAEPTGSDSGPLRHR